MGVGPTRLVRQQLAAPTADRTYPCALTQVSPEEDWEGTYGIKRNGNGVEVCFRSRGKEYLAVERTSVRGVTAVRLR